MVYHLFGVAVSCRLAVVALVLTGHAGNIKVGERAFCNHFLIHMSLVICAHVAVVHSVAQVNVAFVGLVQTCK